MDQVEEAGHGLGAGEAAAGHDKGEPAAPLGRVGLVVGLLEPPEDVVAQPPGVLEGGQGEGVGGHPGQVAEVGHGPQREHQVVVGQRLKGVAPAQVDDLRSGSTPSTSARRNRVRGQAARSDTPTLPASTDPAATSASIGVKSR